MERHIREGKMWQTREGKKKQTNEGRANQGSKRQTSLMKEIANQERNEDANQGMK